MKQQYDMVVVVPIGPFCNKNYIADTIHSVYAYCNCTFKIILTDDSGSEKMGTQVKELFPDADLYQHPKRLGLGGGLYINLALAYSYALANYSFSVLFKIDTDALVIGPDPQKDAQKLFENGSNIGIAGFHVFRLDTFVFDKSVDSRWPRNHLMRATCTWRYIKRPIDNYKLRQLFFKALANGYEIGENVFGGAYFVNPALLVSLSNADLLPHNKLKSSRLEEDHIFGMLAKVLNFNLGNLSGPGLPFAVCQNTLPASPDELHQARKKVIHSTRKWEDMDEGDIRKYFAGIRIKDNSDSPATFPL